MKPKQNYTADKYVPAGMDACQTPSYALTPLIPYLKHWWRVWEPAAGECLLANALYKRVLTVITGDLISGENFFNYAPMAYDCQITNPPYGIKYQWLQRCYELGKPFALLLPVETLGAKAGQVLFAEYGAEFIFMRPRVDFKMPDKGWNSSAQFPTMWVTYKMNIGQEITFVDISEEKNRFKESLKCEI